MTNLLATILITISTNWTTVSTSQFTQRENH